MMARYGAAVLRRLCAELLDRADYLLTLARLSMCLDWLAPLQETPTDQANPGRGRAAAQGFSMARRATAAMILDQRLRETSNPPHAKRRLSRCGCNNRRV
jgi:hypothetical protein